ncbi:hypothetical protein [Aquibacillus albus]|uniref:DUF3139 domain-containing protein n=1 Tax=Aquibacillus albus TaxID=1168171 RepID=A0ABS2MVM1_9BACI|nr:hypothetical protein [Aquibacillus albus]MBM7569930.1 hypothetical protein [Aquibacillus albus]
MKKLLFLFLIIAISVVGWMISSKQQYEFLYSKAQKSSSTGPEVALEPNDECYYIPDLNYKEAMDWHTNKLSSLGWTGEVTSDDVPVSGIYEKEGKKFQLIFYPEASADNEGVGLLIKDIN